MSHGSASAVQPESLLQAVLFEEGFKKTAAQQLGRWCFFNCMDLMSDDSSEHLAR